MGEEAAEVMAVVYGKDKKIEKADAERQESMKIAKDPFESMYGDDIIAPPFDPYQLAKLIKMSNTLPQCIEAMEQNCEGFGYNLVKTVSDEDIESIKDLVDDEKSRVDNFFKYVSFEMSFTKLRKKMRKDLEGFGNAYMEILRNGSGEVDGFEYIKAITVRLGGLSKPTEIEIYRKEPDSHDYITVLYRKRFRIFVQIVGYEKVYFKEFGDPRVIDSTTGKEVDQNMIDMALAREEPIQYATELMHFKIEDPESSYGIPRWTGNMTSVAGSRASEEVNFSYFDNKAIPPLVVMVSGGALAKSAHEKIKEFVEQDIKGRENFHKIMILEADSKSGPHSLEKPTVKIEIKELVQMKEGMWQAYDEKNREKIRSSFRLPPIYVGLAQDYSRATAKESKEVAEEQVFGPEKSDFDFMINNKIFPELDVKYHRFETKSAPIDNRKTMSEIIKLMGEAGLTVLEVRKLLDKLADIELEVIDPEEEGNAWLKVPMKLAQMMMSAQMRASGNKNGDGNDGDDPDKKAAQFQLALVDSLKLLGTSLREAGKE